MYTPCNMGENFRSGIAEATLMNICPLDTIVTINAENSLHCIPNVSYSRSPAHVNSIGYRFINAASYLELIQS